MHLLRWKITETWARTSILLVVARLEKQLGSGVGACYLGGMTATAERVLEQIRRLPPADLAAIWHGMHELDPRPAPAPAMTPVPSLTIEELNATVERLVNRPTRRGSTSRLLEERVRERERERNKTAQYPDLRPRRGDG